MTRDPKDRTPRWFKFYPKNWIDTITLPNHQAGSKFKRMVSRLIDGKAPTGTEEARMIEEAEAYCARQRSRISGYWNSRRPAEPPPEKAETPDGNGTEPPELDEVYDLCAVAGIDPDTGREFHEWMTRKDLWKTLRAPWNVALRGFDRRKRERSAARKNRQRQDPQPPNQEEDT